MGIGLPTIYLFHLEVFLSLECGFFRRVRAIQMLLEPQFEDSEVWLAAGWPWLLLRSDYKQISDVF